MMTNLQRKHRIHLNNDQRYTIRKRKQAAKTTLLIHITTVTVITPVSYLYHPAVLQEGRVVQ
jgi:hypothetical protein